jgi:hypothetical protein
MMGQAKPREVPKIRSATLERSWHHAQPLHTMSSGQKRLVGPLQLELGSNRPREKIDDRVAQVSVLVRVPRAEEKVE